MNYRKYEPQDSENGGKRSVFAGMPSWQQMLWEWNIVFIVASIAIIVYQDWQDSRDRAAAAEWSRQHPITISADLDMKTSMIQGK